MTAYRHIIFDADHTLIDFNLDEKRAFRTAFCGTPLLREEIIEQIWKFSYENWEELGLNNVNDCKIREKYHALYHVHIDALFDYAQRELGLTQKEERRERFYRELCSIAAPREGALETVKELSKRYCVSVATNGLKEMQCARLKQFTPYLFRLFISEEMNCIKPSTQFGKLLLTELNSPAEECLFVGDSLSSDIALANKLGMPAVWYNPQGQPLLKGYRVKEQIQSLKELLHIL